MAAYHQRNRAPADRQRHVVTHLRGGDSAGALRHLTTCEALWRLNDVAALDTKPLAPRPHQPFLLQAPIPPIPFALGTALPH